MFAKATLASAVMALVTTLSLASAAPAAAHPDEDRLQGTWKIISQNEDGEPIPEREWKQDKIVIEGRSLLSYPESTDGKADPVKGTYVLKKEGIDIVFEHPAIGRLVIPALYRVQGDRLTICVSPGPNDTFVRPPDLTPGPGKVVTVLQRARR
jgi:uncharacterized protein (TIGR03067 family)